MSTLPFKLSTQELTFPRNQPFTRVIQITKLSDIVVVAVGIVHNLPECFSVTPNDYLITVPNKLEIKYDPKLSVDEMPSVLNIKIAYLFREVIQVAVRFEEEEVVSEVLQCQICLCKYDEDDKDLLPRFLIGCGHTICEKCARTLRSPGNAFPGFQKKAIACPFDRKPTTVPPEGLPTNYSVLEMLREKKALDLEKKKYEQSKLSEDPDVPCYENENHEATCYCETCKVDLCQGCFLSTHSSRVFSGHRSIPISERPLALPKCEIHPKNDARYLCREIVCFAAPKLFCDECRFFQHSSHEYSNYETTVAENQENLEKVAEKLKSMEQNLQVQHQKAKKCELTYEQSNPECIEKIMKIHQYFDKQKAEALDKLANFRRTEKEKISQEADEILHGITMISEAKRKIERVLKQRNRIHDVQELMGKGTALLSLEHGSGENFTPFSVDMFPDDMSTIASPVVMEDPKENQRDLMERACIKRFVAKAVRRFT